MICILGSMYEEVKSLISRLENVYAIPDLNRNFIVGTYKNVEIIIGVTGCGVINASITAQYIINNYNIERIYFIGTAGSLTNNTKGSVYCINNVSCDIEDHDILTLNNITNGIHLFTSSHTVCSNNEKEELKEKGYDLVDMEGYGVAYTSKISGVVCEIIKVVSDNADESFDKDFAESINACIQIPCDIVMSKIDSLLERKISMEIGDIEILNINGLTLKMRLEEDGYYCYVPTCGTVINFNPVGFQILKLISEGCNKDKVLEKISEKHNLNREVMKQHIDNYYEYIISLNIPIQL